MVDDDVAIDLITSVRFIVGGWDVDVLLDEPLSRSIRHFQAFIVVPYILEP